MILGTVNSVTLDGATVIVDGEDQPTTKKYQSSQPVCTGDRVMMEQFGDTYQIVGKVRNIQSFDMTSDDETSLYIQLKPKRTYLLVASQWYGGGTHGRTDASLVSTGRTSDSPYKIDLANGSSFSTYSNCQIRFSRTYSFAHVAIIEL